MSNIYKDKKVLVTGGTGLIGKPLVEMLIASRAKVSIVSLDDPSRVHSGANFHRADLRDRDQCKMVSEGMDFIFHLAGIKGSPAMLAKYPAKFLVPMLQFNVAMMEAARSCNVGWFLFTSSNGVYAPAEIMYEDGMMDSLPSKHERITAWSKRVPELQAEAYAIEGWDRVSIVRPANVYGPYDNFDPENAMVIPSLIYKALSGQNPLTVWGDGSPVRDFIHAEDVARGMMMVVEKQLRQNQPVNLGSGIGVTIKKIVDTILSNLSPKPEIFWDTSRPTGDKKRVLDTTRAKSIGFEPRISIEEGIREVMEWYRENRSTKDKRYNIFTKED